MFVEFLFSYYFSKSLHSIRQADKDYYNDLPGKTPPDISPLEVTPPVPPLPLNNTHYRYLLIILFGLSIFSSKNFFYFFVMCKFTHRITFRLILSLIILILNLLLCLLEIFFFC